MENLQNQQTLSPAVAREYKRYSILNDVLGPIGCGPSSSHTIAPQRIAYEAYKKLGGHPDSAEVFLFNSFSTTGQGHRSDIAIIAGLLGLRSEDPKTRNSKILLRKSAMKIDFIEKIDESRHPNYIEMVLKKGSTVLFLQAISIGGGNYKILQSSTNIN